MIFADGCELVDAALQGRARAAVIDHASAAPAMRNALARLREPLCSHLWRAGGRTINLARVVSACDARTRADGFHVLNDWDGKADRINDETIAVDVLRYLDVRRGGDPVDRTAVAILVDYYYLNLLALLSLRIWDEGDADENLDRLEALLRLLHGEGGSGQQFVADAETLILVATSHFEVVERGYARLLARVAALNRPHRVKVALGHASSMSSHLRFGFEASYGRDTLRMRDDNVADYPWLSFALLTLMREYAREPCEAVAEALLNGLAPDARAFLGQHPPSSLAASEAERSEFAALFEQHQPRLVEAFERFRPSNDRYSPLSFFFNFSHNVVKGAVVDALLHGRPWDVSLNDLLTALPPRDAKKALAETLMAYARDNPDRIGGRLMPVIVYDPQAGRRAFTVTMRKITEARQGG